jgi:hypothetical protein
MKKPQEKTTETSEKIAAGFLNRMLPSVDMHPADRMLEIFSAILLSLATVSSAWCAYQAARWNGVQSIHFSDSAAAGREAIHYSLLGQQRIAIDVSMFLEFAAAKTQDNNILADFLYQRFNTELKNSTDAWLALKPLKNPDAPPSPFEMPEYFIEELQTAKHLRLQMEEKQMAARSANRASDNYVLLTVLFAMVLFFGGIANKFQSRRVKTGVLLVGTAVYLSTLVMIIRYPIY